MSKLRDFFLSLRKRKGLLIVIVAVSLLELLSAAQYFFTHNLMEDELEKYAEMELTTKAIITKRIVEDSEHNGGKIQPLHTRLLVQHCCTDCQVRP